MNAEQHFSEIKKSQEEIQAMLNLVLQKLSTLDAAVTAASSSSDAKGTKASASGTKDPLVHSSKATFKRVLAHLYDTDENASKALAVRFRDAFLAYVTTKHGAPLAEEFKRCFGAVTPPPVSQTYMNDLIAAMESMFNPYGALKKTAKEEAAKGFTASLATDNVELANAVRQLLDSGKSSKGGSTASSISSNTNATSIGGAGNPIMSGANTNGGFTFGGESNGFFNT